METHRVAYVVLALALSSVLTSGRSAPDTQMTLGRLATGKAAVPNVRPATPDLLNWLARVGGPIHSTRMAALRWVSEDALRVGASVLDMQSLADSPEAVLGARLFREARFSQYFFDRAKGRINAPLPSGDPVMNQVPTTTDYELPAVHPGEGINCRQCHLGDDYLPARRLFGRTYCDFSRRSPTPRRDDAVTVTLRNSPLTIDLETYPESQQVFHFDGEFASLEDLITQTVTGRNFGWLPSELATASAHVARVIREDDGRNVLGDYYSAGSSYRAILAAVDPQIPPGLRLPAAYRLQVLTASDGEILGAVARLMHAYLSALRFGTVGTGRRLGSAYDLFLDKNGLQKAPRPNETNSAYATRLADLIERLAEPRWVTESDGSLQLHSQTFTFGPAELKGMKVFFATAVPKKMHGGGCVQCHTPPVFSDRRFHNTGVSQLEYDRLFGTGAFALLQIPSLAERNRAFDRFLPPSASHPIAAGTFHSEPSIGQPGHADLGLWNVFANPDLPKPQAALTTLLYADLTCGRSTCRDDVLLPLTIARFKTPSIRDLGQSNPYMHNGSVDTIEDIVRFYMSVSALARAGRLRNADRRLLSVRVGEEDVAPLTAFLRSLNEDYR
jgi:cytochrome c peroxidase